MYILLLKSVNDQVLTPLDDPYVQILSNAGYQAGLIETLGFSYHISQLSNYQTWRDSHSAIVFTSPRAVIAFTKAGLIGRESDLCFVVGPSTEVLAKKAGFSPVGASTGDAEELSKYIINNFSAKLVKPVFFPAGQLHREQLPSYLEQHGVKVNTVIVYSSHEQEKLKDQLRLNLCERNPIPDCLVFFSPSGVSFTEDILKTELKPHRPQIKLVTMGRATQSKLEDLGLVVSAVAQSCQPSGLLDAIKQLG